MSPNLSYVDCPMCLCKRPMVEILDRVPQAYTTALDDATLELRSLLASTKSKSWRSVPANEVSIALNNVKGKIKETSDLSLGDISVYRKPAKGAEVVRATAEFSCKDIQIQDFRAVLSRPEVRPQWDRLAERAKVLESVDPQTLITKTSWKLGWPISPRDAVTIAKTFGDDTSLIHIATSLPRIAEGEPSYLRPSPPYVRSHVHLYAVCISLPNAGSSDKGRIQLFSKWQLKGAVPAHSAAELAALLSSILDYTAQKGDTIPLISGFGKGVELSSLEYQTGDESLSLEYVIIAEDHLDQAEEKAVKGLDDLILLKEKRRLERSLEIGLHTLHGWQLSVSVSGHGIENPESSWSATVGKSSASNRAVFKITHSRLASPELVARVKLNVRRLAGGRAIRINSQLLSVGEIEERDPVSHTRRILEDAANAVLPSSSSNRSDTVESAKASAESPSSATFALKANLQAVQDQISTSIRRSYTYFASLLQEPEAKWRHVTETRGVSISQLNSIDPTVTIFRAVATFVGVGVWDLFATVQSPGARLAWDKSLEEVIMLEDVDELSSLWYMRYKAVWPAWARDSVLLRTAYKSPTSVHIFSFSVEDSRTFSTLPPLPPNTIRSNTVIQGWAIEALSPTTTQVTLIEQTDLKGWSNRSWTYQQMVASAAGVGEFAIKCGAPPVVTRLHGAKALLANYNHEKGSLKLEYKPLITPLLRRADSAVADRSSGGEAKPLTNGVISATGIKSSEKLYVECELRADVDIWSSSLDIVTDPPPTRCSVLARHRLASSGGCWITIEHDRSLSTASNEKIMILVRKGSASRSKGSVYLNGAKVQVDSESLATDQVKVLTQQKRIKASPITLDHWPSTSISRPSSPKPSPIDLAPASVPVGTSVPSTPRDSSVELPSLAYALDALALLQAFHAVQGPDLSSPVPGWTTISDKGGFLRRRIVQSLSPIYPVLRGDKVVEGLAAEQLLAQIVNHQARLKWDTKLEICRLLESYGNGCATSLQVTKPAFLTFRNRVFHLSSVQSHICIPSASATSSTSRIYLVASASSPFTTLHPATNLNPQAYPIGQLVFEGWILETIDPYTSQTFAIPSTRISHFSCVNWGGAVPQALGSMLNPSPIKVIDAVAQQAQQSIAVPRLLVPASTVQVEGPLSADSGNECEWILNQDYKRQEPLLLSTTFSPDRFHFGFILLVNALSAEGSSMVGATNNKSHNRSFSQPNPPAAPSKQARIPILRSPASLASIPQSPRLDQVSEDDEPVSTSSTAPNELLNTNYLSSPPSGKTKNRMQDMLLSECIFDSDPAMQACELDIKVIESQALPLLDESGQSVDLPIRVSVHDMPQSSGLTLSKSTIERRQYLLRLTLPTAQYLSPINDPLRDQPRRVFPEWFKTLQCKSVVVHVSITGVVPQIQTPLSEKQPAMNKLRILFKENELHLVSERESRAILEHHADEDWAIHAAQLSRVSKRIPSDPRTREGLPAAFCEPAAIAAPDSPSSPISTNQLSATEQPAFKSKHLESAAKPATSVPSDRKMSLNATEQPPVTESSAITNVLGSFPFSLVATDSLDLQSEVKSRKFSVQFVLMVAVISFLLGSLLRSLLTPADFIFSGDVDMAMLQGLDSNRRWRQARRLVELRTWGNYDYIIAAVKKTAQKKVG